MQGPAKAGSKSAKYSRLIQSSLIWKAKWDEQPKAKLQ